MIRSIYIIIFFLFILSCSSQTINLFYGGGGTSVGPNSNLSDYEMGTVVFSSINLTFTTFNILRLTKNNKNKSNAGFALISGASQIVMTALADKSGDKNGNFLTAVNITVGMTTITTSIFRLIKKDTDKDKKVAFNIVCFPPINQRSGTLCFSIIGKLN